MKRAQGKRLRLLLFAIISEEFERVDRLWTFPPLMRLAQVISAMLVFQYEFKLIGAQIVEVDFVPGDTTILKSIVYEHLCDGDAKKGYRVTCQIDKTEMESEPSKCLLAACHTALIALCRHDGADEKIVDLVFKRILEEGQSARIYLKGAAKSIRRYFIAPFIRIMEPVKESDTSLYLQVEDTKTGKSGVLHVAQERFEVATWFCESVKMERQNIVCKPYLATWVEAYGRRGFKMPITVPIADFFNPEFQELEPGVNIGAVG